MDRRRGTTPKKAPGGKPVLAGAGKRPEENRSREELEAGGGTKALGAGARAGPPPSRRPLKPPCMSKIQSDLRPKPSVIPTQTRSQPMLVKRDLFNERDRPFPEGELPPDCSSVTEEEADILEGMYSEYLQQRLIAQMLTKQRRQFTEALPMNFIEASKDEILLHFQLQLEIFAFKKVLADLTEIDNISQLDTTMDVLLGQISNPDVKSCLDNFNQDLSVNLDYVKNSGSGGDKLELRLQALQEAQKEIQEAGNGSTLAFKILSDAVSQGIEVTKLLKSVTHEEKELNDMMRKLASLKLCKEMLAKLENSDEHQINIDSMAT